MPVNVLHELCEREAAARRRRDYHHQQFDWVLASLKALGADPPGVPCPKVQAAGQALSRASRGHIQQPVMVFADTLLEFARSKPENDQGEGVKRLASLAVAHMRELAYHVDQEVKAQREVLQYTSAMSLADAANQNSYGPGGQGG